MRIDNIKKDEIYLYYGGISLEPRPFDRLQNGLKIVKRDSFLCRFGNFSVVASELINLQRESYRLKFPNLHYLSGDTMDGLG